MHWGLRALLCEPCALCVKIFDVSKILRFSGSLPSSRPVARTFLGFILVRFGLFAFQGAQVTASQKVLRFVDFISHFFSIAISSAQQIPENTYQDLHWRMIGPFRGGRTRAATGVSHSTDVFYMGQVNGGVWKSNDYGRTWNTHLRSRIDAIHRRYRRRSLQSQHYLCRQRRGLASPRPLSRQRNLQINRLWKNLDSSRLARRRANSRAGHRPA